jgi:hypothetical protein
MSHVLQHDGSMLAILIEAPARSANHLCRGESTSRSVMDDADRRNVAMTGAVLSSGQYLIHDRDGKFCQAFQQIIDAGRVTRIRLPAQSPNLNAYAGRWVRAVKDGCPSRPPQAGGATLPQPLTH